MLAPHVEPALPEPADADPDWGPRVRLDSQHAAFLCAAVGVARADPAGLAQIQRVAQRAGLDAVGKARDRAEMRSLIQELAAADLVTWGESEYARTCGSLRVTDQGFRYADGTASSR